MKKCTKCGIEKELCLFYFDKKGKDKKTAQCKICSTKRVKKWKQKNEVWAKAYQKDWYLKNKEKFIKHIRKYNQEKDFGLLFKYLSMKNRCYQKSQHAYKWYGAKGIKVEWTSYQEFKKDMYESYIEHINQFGHKQTTLDRINVNGNYNKENCRWATWKEQGNNRSNNITQKCA